MCTVLTGEAHLSSISPMPSISHSSMPSPPNSPSQKPPYLAMNCSPSDEHIVASETHSSGFSIQLFCFIYFSDDVVLGRYILPTLAGD